MNLQECLARWARVRKPSPHTIVRYEQAVRSFEKFGIKAIGDVRPEVVSVYVEFRLVFVEPVTVEGDMAALTTLLRFARADVAIIAAVKLCLPRSPKPKRLTAPHLDRGEVDTLVESARNRAPSAELPALVDVYLGLRIRELCRLRWSEIDLGARPSVFVRIVEELGPEGRIKTSTERVVPVCAELKTLLTERRADFGRDYLFPPGLDAAGVGSKHPFMRPHSMRRSLARAVQHAAKPLSVPVSWLTLRHTRASWWVQAGVPMAKVAKWLGNSLEVCERYYAGLRDGYDPDCERIPAA